MQQRPKIAFLTAYLSTGGAERVTINIANAFFRKDFEVQIVAASIVPQSLSLLPKELKVFDLNNSKPLDSPSFYKNTRSLIKYIRAEKPDVVLSTSDYLNIALVFARFFSRKKFKIIVAQQVHVSAYLQELPRLNRIFVSAIQRMVIRHADLVLGVSEGVVRDLQDRYRVPAARRKKFHAIHNPLFEERIIQMSTEPIAEKAFNTNAVKLITVGRLVKQKDHETLFRAFALTITQIPGAVLFVVGVGGEESRLRKLAADLGIASQVIFLGYTQNPYAYVAKCDLFVLSSQYEGFGNVIVEALATGTNVVSTDCPSGPAEILDNGAYGFLSPVGDAAQLSQTILTALHNPKPAALLQERAREFGIDAIARKYMDVVLPLL